MCLESKPYASILQNPAVRLVGLAVLIGSALLWKRTHGFGYITSIAGRQDSLAGIFDIGVLVFREGLECVLVLSAITASMSKAGDPYERPVAAGVGAAIVVTIGTWFVAVHIVNDLSENLDALSVQAGTGLLAILVLLVVMNWFFHKVYWTGWISLHNKRKRELLERVGQQRIARSRLLVGMAMLGFTSFYREGVEVVLFLQSYRLKMGTKPVLYGTVLGVLLTSVVAILTFLAHKKLPYKQMLVLSGFLLGMVLLVMVGEEVQEMQLAHWLPTTIIPALRDKIPAWAELWFSIFPTIQTLSAQAFAALLVLGSYVAAKKQPLRA